MKNVIYLILWKKCGIKIARSILFCLYCLCLLYTSITYWKWVYFYHFIFSCVFTCAYTRNLCIPLHAIAIFPFHDFIVCRVYNESKRMKKKNKNYLRFHPYNFYVNLIKCFSFLLLISFLFALIWLFAYFVFLCLIPAHGIAMVFSL